MEWGSIFECFLEVLVGFWANCIGVTFGAGLMEDVGVRVYDEELRLLEKILYRQLAYHILGISFYR